MSTGSIQDNAYLSSLIKGSANNSGAKQAAEPANNELGKDAFLELMVAQLKNQSPLNPTENGEFVAQLAQFSSVESLDNLNSRFDSFANSFQSNQALQASSLVGRSVTVPASSALLAQGGVVSGVGKLPTSSSDVELTISAKGGNVVGRVPLGSLPEGDHNFRWDGKQLELNGELLDWKSGLDEVPAGEYQFRLSGTVAGKNEQFDTSLSAMVSSVTLGTNNQLTLNLKGMGSVAFSDIEQINQ
ncbi:MAG: flagellar hook assembly protein FlgD [Cellvibrionaceae bacterium]|nr:flagellar hook assembly protein FlgD [Cellvibrionaceae bacterium]